MGRPTETRKLRIGGHGLAYHRKGSGQPLIMVHGIVTYSFLWDDIADALSENYDVIWLDLLGCGDSEKPIGVDYSIKAHAHRLKEFADHLDIGRFHLISHDIGGGIAQIYAVNYPEDLYDAVLINSVGYDFWPVQPIIAMRTPIIRQLALAALDSGILRKIVSAGLFYKERLSPDLMAHYKAPFRTTEGRKAFLHFAKCLDNKHLLEIESDLRKLDLPVLIIRGDADPYLSLEISEKLHSEIPGSRLVRIPTGGHFVQIDEPEFLTK
ncbi:alpha/beta hydrolase, partial [bacterium]|nr:alpha/beta hydrolase [bacterium]